VYVLLFEDCFKVFQIKSEKISIEEKQKYRLLKLIEKNGTDLRRTINDLQKFSISGSLIISEENQIIAESIQ
jgi:hypothetical protein